MSCDQDRYDERWELDVSTALRMFVPNPTNQIEHLLCSRETCPPHKICIEQLASNSIILDLRQDEDWKAWHLVGSCSSPLKGLSADVTDLFGDADSIHLFWTLLRTKITRELDLDMLLQLSVLVLCYDGEASRLATSLLRAKGCDAYSVLGGFTSLRTAASSGGKDVVA